MAVTTSNDDGFREIQLNGKQLVFLFMAVTVVLVVTFLTGVLVGRGVRAERVAEQQTEAAIEAPAPPERGPVAPPPDAADPTKASPPEVVGADPESDTKAEPAPPEEPPVAVTRNPQPPSASQPKPADVATRNAPAAPAAVAPNRPPAAAAAPPPAAAASRTPTPAPAPAAAPPTAPPTPGPAATSTTDSPVRNGYAVQVAAVNVRGEADTIARRLSGKGYSAYVENPRGSQTMYRVRVGTFKTRREAQSVADRLKKEENFKPWVTR